MTTQQEQLIEKIVKDELAIRDKAKTDQAAIAALIKDQVAAAMAEKTEQTNEMIATAVKAALQNESVQRNKWFASAEHEDKNVEKGVKFARFVRGLARSNGNPEQALEYVTAEYGDYSGKAALSASVFEAGGAIVPAEYSEEIIALLRTRTVVRALGATSIPMASGTLTFPRQTAGGTAFYIGESANIPVSRPAFGQLTLSVKKLAALTPISNDLIRDSSPAVDTLVRDDLVTVMALREDLAFLRDDGTVNTPRGLRHWVHPGNVFAQSAPVTLATVTDDLFRAMRLLDEANIPMQRLGWIFAPRTKWFLMTLRNAQGNLIFESEMRNNTLLGIPFRTTTQIPINLGVGGNASEIYLADFAQAIIGENMQLIVGIYEGGTYHDGTQIVSGLSTDQTVVRTLARHDFALRHDRAASIITGVTWGA